MRKLPPLLLCFLLLAACSGQNQAPDEAQNSDSNTAVDEGALAKELQVEKGVSLDLAQWRAAAISDIVYDLSFTVPVDAAASIDAREILTFVLSDTSQNLQLDFREGESAVKKVVVNDAEQKIDHRNEHLVISSTALVQGENKIDIEFVAGESSLNRKTDYFYTLFVPDRARTAFPVFDQPNLKARYRLTLDLPETWRALANAPLESVEETNNGRRRHRFQLSDLISTYLFSFVAGEFQLAKREINGREIVFLHRETDQEKVARNIDAIFSLHADALAWLEEYTGVPYPFQKFSFVAIPAFQYGGMEHVGAIQYRASTVFLEEDPSQPQQLARASLIAHETAHMWFGDLVTMDWFNDVWTKEVFANFMAAKVVNPSFPDIEHELNFLLRSYPAAYSVDRTQGANPIRQALPNLNEAGTLYGAIIYNKAPIMMRQLELLLGEGAFRDGLREYLNTFANSNATWPDLIDILTSRSEHDLRSWSDVWVNTPGRPTFRFEKNEGGGAVLKQFDTSGADRYWPQQFALARRDQMGQPFDVRFANAESVAIDTDDETSVFVNADGKGYGLFPVSMDLFEAQWGALSPLQKGALLVNLYEQMLENNPSVIPTEYIDHLTWAAGRETNELLLDAIFGQIQTIYWSYLTLNERMTRAIELEEVLWREATDGVRASSTKKAYLRAFQNIATSPAGVDRLHRLWEGVLIIDGVALSEREVAALAGTLAVKQPDNADEVIARQLERFKNPDNLRRFEFIAPALSPSSQIRDQFFASLAEEENRDTESWVIAALGYLHHPLRTDQSAKYILPSLELLGEIQETGDIFFPARWTGQTLRNHKSTEAAETVRNFLDARPNYNAQLRLKILQSADPLFRAEQILVAKETP